MPKLKNRGAAACYDNRKSNRRHLASQIALRLRAVMAYLEKDTVQAFADFIGEDRSTVSHWLNSGWMPPVPAMVELNRRTGITLDWIYQGNPSGLPDSMAILLTALMEGDVPVFGEEPLGSGGPTNLLARRTSKREAAASSANGGA